jgi:hypothetical protein
LVKRWKAHKDAINWITWVPELEVSGSCSYDCNVYLWNRECDKVGSLVLGNKATAPDQVPDPETARYRKDWQITINKITRYEDEISEAKEIWDKIRDPKAPSYQQLKADAIQKQRRLDRQALTPSDMMNDNGNPAVGKLRKA